MEVFLIFVGIIVALLILIGFVCVTSVWICNAISPCYHSYERVDTCNDKKMILVCQRCGKIKKLRK